MRRDWPCRGHGQSEEPFLDDFEVEQPEDQLRNPIEQLFKAIRAKTKLTQARFAATLRVPVATIRDWDRRAPDAPARTLLGMVDADPQAALALIGRMAG